MSLTLNDLGFEFDKTDMETIDTEVQDGIIKPSTTFIDTPVKINDFLKDLTTALENLFNTNLENLAADFDDWFSQKAADL